MKRHSPVIALIIFMCASYIARIWWTPLLADTVFSIGLPLGMFGSLGALSFAMLVVFSMPLSDRRRERLRTIGVLLSVVACSIVFDFAYGRGLPAGSFARDFNSARWTDENAAGYQRGDITDRQKMLGNVVHQVLHTSNREQVESLLGARTPDSYFAESQPDLLYYLGPERSFIGIDSEWLAIWFNENSTVKHWELLTD